MVAKRLKGLYFANIAAATAELNGPTDMVDLITESIFQRLVRACEYELKNTVDTTRSTEVVGKTIKRRRRPYIMQPSQISLSRREVDLDHIFSSRAQFYGAMAAKRLKAHYYGNIASAKTESNVPNDLVDQIPGSTFRQLVANCVKDLARTACVPELLFACAQNLPA
ncbi:unnamed protein product [Macrosiphum euphorbiae]|uniref:Uncharacterized protein n=1 Tax=Macrosiphum euphorbiae TaxID=13131 RepID=A0AAV0VGA3_9HEMI|nr:unnamed protein product [Macrosiphum euphorbiae]